jgi:hypothetical protein
LSVDRKTGDFLFIQQDPVGSPEMRVVLNWFEELKRLVPTDG